MNFEKALEQVKKGKKYKRKTFHNTVISLESSDPVRIVVETTKTKTYTPTHADLLAEDWEEVT